MVRFGHCTTRGRAMESLLGSQFQRGGIGLGDESCEITRLPKHPRYLFPSFSTHMRHVVAAGRCRNRQLVYLKELTGCRTHKVHVNLLSPLALSWTSSDYPSCLVFVWGGIARPYMSSTARCFRAPPPVKVNSRISVTGALEYSHSNK